MESAIPQERLTEILRDAQARTDVSRAAVALHVDGRTTFAGEHPRPFRVASITKSFTATAVSLAGLLDDRRRALLSHTAGYRPERPEPLPVECAGLWSYSNAGYWEAASGFDGGYSNAVRELVLEPSACGTPASRRLTTPCWGRCPATSPPTRRMRSSAGRAAACGRRSAISSSTAWRIAASGRISTSPWRRRSARATRSAGGSATAFSTTKDPSAAFSRLLLLVPERTVVLAVLTNSWRGSALIHQVVEDIGLAPPAAQEPHAVEAVGGKYELDELAAVVADGSVTESEPDPVTGTRLERRYPLRPDATLMTWRCDFPRPGVARIGWVALPRVKD
jgi:hypothetical protein